MLTAGPTSVLGEALKAAAISAALELWALQVKGETIFNTKNLVIMRTMRTPQAMALRMNVLKRSAYIPGGQQETPLES